jgi:hypothetical protein
MERLLLVEHILEHYVSRDLFRYYAAKKLQRVGMNTSTSFLNTQDAVPVAYYRGIERTRASLKKVKPVTLDHLHNLLHEDFMLPNFEHIHDGGQIFSYIIQEELDALRFA